MSDSSCRYVILIPAYNPESSLLKLCEMLINLGFHKILVVNDGSRKSCEVIFNQLVSIGISVFNHPINLGKGAALKTGFICVENYFKDFDGIITADADGQHTPKDIKRLADEMSLRAPDLILGVRTFHGSVPLRSKFGNKLTMKLLFFFTGMKIKDTQTGLRGIKTSSITEFLKIKSNGYDFELDMLLLANNKKLSISQLPIETVYIDNNSSSHFNPFFDSLKIYFILFRFLIFSVLTQLLDLLLFSFLLSFQFSIPGSTVLARSMALIFNFIVNRRYVFHSKHNVRTEILQFLALAVFLMITSYTLMNFLSDYFGISLVVAKIISDSLLFVFNFLLQRFLIFSLWRDWGRAKGQKV